MNLFIQLLHLRGIDHEGVDAWLNKKTNKYTSPVIQNECLKLMALHILRDVSRSTCIADSHCFSIVALTVRTKNNSQLTFVGLISN